MSDFETFSVTGRAPLDDGTYEYTLSQVAPDIDAAGGYVEAAPSLEVTAYEANNALVEVGSVVAARFKHSSGGHPVYEFFDGAGSARTVVKVTSGTVDGDGNYPAVTTRWGTADEVWADGETVVKLKAANGETLVSGNRYLAVPAGPNAADETVYVMDGGVPAAAGAAAAAIVCVTSATPRADGLLNGVVMEWSAGAVDLGTSATACAVFLPHGEDVVASYDVQYSAVRTGTAALDGKPVFTVSLPEAGRSSTANWHGVLTGGTGSYAQYVPGVGLNWGDLANSYPYLEAVNEPVRVHDTTGTQYAMPMYTGYGAAVGFTAPGSLRAMKCGIGCLDNDVDSLVLYASTLTAGYFEEHTAVRVEPGRVTVGRWDYAGDLVAPELGSISPTPTEFVAPLYGTYYDDGTGTIEYASGDSGTLPGGGTVANGLVVAVGGGNIDFGTW